MDGADLAHLILTSAAVIAVALSWRVPRAKMWVGFGALSYVTSAWWHNAGLPYATEYGAATNLLICYMFWIFAERRYEMRLWNFFHLMLVVDLLYIFGAIHDKLVFAVSLELINLAALIFVGGIGIVERSGGIYTRAPRVRRSGLVYRLLWSERSIHSRPWWQK